jgi:methylglutaconyl-CoA hydratase
MSYLLESIDDRGVATLTLNRPARRNAFDDDLVRNLTTAFRRAESNEAVRVVVLCGAGNCFCAGGDIEWMKRAAEQSCEENLADAISLAEMMQTLDRLSKPTIALVHGAVYGGGVGLVACCDIVIASEDASFCLSEVRLGIIPAVVAPYVARSIGVRQARRIFLTAEILSATKAAGIGLVHEVVKENEMEAASDRIVSELLLGAPGAQTEAKSLIALCYAHPLDQMLMEETACRIAKARATAEGKEGLSAFLNKRRPAWLTSRDA